MKKGNWVNQEDRNGDKARLPSRAKKKQVVETTCGSHEKTSEDSHTKPGNCLQKIVNPRGNIFDLKVVTVK